MQILTVVVTFILGTVVGGLLTSRWQHRNWVRQQSISQQDRIIAELKLVFVELDAVLSKRLYRTRRVLWALRHNPSALDNRLKEYEEAIAEWNEKRNSFQIRLVRIVSLDLANYLEHDLARQLVRAGAKIERLVRQHRTGAPPRTFKSRLTEIEEGLSLTGRSVYVFMRSIYIQLQSEQDKLFRIDNLNRIPEDERDLEHLSTWFLLKTLFVPVPIQIK